MHYPFLSDNLGKQNIILDTGRLKTIIQWDLLFFSPRSHYITDSKTVFEKSTIKIKHIKEAITKKREQSIEFSILAWMAGVLAGNFPEEERNSKKYIA